MRYLSALTIVVCISGFAGDQIVKFHSYREVEDLSVFKLQNFKPFTEGGQEDYKGVDGQPRRIFRYKNNDGSGADLKIVINCNLLPTAEKSIPFMVVLYSNIDKYSANVKNPIEVQTAVIKSFLSSFKDLSESPDRIIQNLPMAKHSDYHKRYIKSGTKFNDVIVDSFDGITAVAIDFTKSY